MTMDGSTKSWEMLPTETDQQFAAFEAYRKLSPYGVGEEKRTVDNVRKKLGLKWTGTLENWSTKNNWVDRVRAYDSFIASTSITVAQKSAEEFAIHIVTTTTARLAYAGMLIERKMKKLADQMDAGTDVDASELKAVVAAIKQIDDLSRRSAGLPTSYTQEQATNEVPEDKDVFIVGAN